MNFGCFLAAFIILLQFSLCNMLSSLQFVELLPKMEKLILLRAILSSAYF